ncbi:hypothetical protein C8J57DRAFT_1657151 [Mycena rebaudengoi]|nr:hypothetical protein C8J57DRAFT_1657151 [Mycena rebaudengoi]
MSVCRNCGKQALEPLSPALHEGHLSNRERRAALAKVRAQILLHEKYLDALEEEEAELEAGLALVTYPVLTLPIEITSRIFLHCLPSHGRVSPSPSRAPLVLAQICHHWREVALSTGELWSSLYPSISFGLALAIPSARDHALRSLIQTWFSRAKATPLSLGLNCQLTKVSTALLELVSSFTGQIRSLDLHLYEGQFRQLRTFETRFPLLQHLAISNASEEEIGDFIKDTPTLRELRLTDFTMTTSLNFPLPLLSRLEISAEISITTFLDVLNNFPVLSYFKYSLREPNTVGVDGSMAPVFPHLSSLAGETAALCFVTLPGLRELRLPSFSEPDHVQQCIVRSSCTVDRVTLTFGDELEDEDDDRKELLIWLKAFPSLSVLHIRQCTDVDVLIECLDSKSLAPRLSEITINSSIRPSNIDNNYDDALIALLRRRTNPRRPFKLHKFHMRFSLIHGGDADYESRVWTPGDLAESALDDMIADGLDFLLRIESNHAGTLTWPSGYIDSTDPLPFFP